ncbi:MAG: Transcriptional regulator, AfsR family, partial [uncultured Thermomicrobiales bacterium]
VRAATELGREFPGGTWFLPFAPVRDPALVGSTILHALGVVEHGRRPALDALRTVVQERRLLLVLDNLEHLLAAAAPLAELLAACPNLVVLATSRIRLNLSDEHEHRVSPLVLPSHSRDDRPLALAETVGGSEAVQLFVARARAVDGAFRLTDENAAAVASICAGVDGLPLAIELVAAQLRHFPPAALAARMARRLPLLTGGVRDHPERHRTMAGAIAWSHDLLSPDEQVLFRRLSVFVDGCTLEAAETVAGLSPPSSVLGMVASLVDHQLLGRVDWPHGESRFAMLETIREFAGERLEESGEREDIRRRHAAQILVLADRYEYAELLPDGDRVLALLEAEHSNLRAALGWFRDEGAAGPFLRLAAALGHFWSGQGHYQEGRHWLERALRHGADAPAADRAKALVALGVIQLYLGMHREAESHLTEGLAGCQDHGDPFNAALALVGLGGLATLERDLARGTAFLEEGLATLQAVTDRRLAGIFEGRALNNLAVVARARGDHALADERLREALRRMRDAGYTAGTIEALGDLGDVARDRGDHAGALALYREALGLGRARPGTRQVTDVIEAVGVVAVAAGQVERGARLLGAAAAMRERTGLRYRVAENLVALERAVTAARAALDGSTFEVAWAAG